MGTITRSFANLITASGPSAVADGTIVNADINASAAIDATKLTGISSQPFRNIVINGDMSIAQRNTSVDSITTGGYKTLDRFDLIIDSLGTWTMSKSTDTPTGQGFASSLKLDCTTADASPSAGDRFLVRQLFEGQNLQYLKKGTANALSLTASFWVKSTKTGTFILQIADLDNTRSISKSYTVNASNTWEFKTVTFAGDTTGTLNNDNGPSLSLSFWLGAGSTWSSGTLNTSWSSEVYADIAVGQVNIADSDSNDFLITGVQLEAGEQASGFEFMPIDVNLARCQRYCYAMFANQGGDNYTRYSVGETYTTTSSETHVPFPVNMRTRPSLTTTGTAANYGVYTGDTVIACSTVPTISGGCSSFRGLINSVVASGFTVGRVGQVLSNNNTTSYLIFNAEL